MRGSKATHRTLFQLKRLACRDTKYENFFKGIKLDLSELRLKEQNEVCHKVYNSDNREKSTVIELRFGREAFKHSLSEMLRKSEPIKSHLNGFARSHCIKLAQLRTTQGSIFQILSLIFLKRIEFNKDP